MFFREKGARNNSTFLSGRFWKPKKPHGIFWVGRFLLQRDQGPQGDSRGQIIEDFMEKAHVQKS